ncbi:MAG: NnrU family protein [Rhodospirillales bacterium]
MTLYLLGLALFFVPHLVSTARPLRNSIVAGIGEIPWKLALTAMSFAGITLIALYFHDAPADQLWTPQPWGRAALFALMPVSLILVISANFRGYIRRLVRHPMSAGVIIWSVCHLAANGDIASTLLFGSFLIYSILSPLVAELQGRVRKLENPDWKGDLISIPVGLVLYAALMHFHATLFGVAIVG